MPVCLESRSRTSATGTAFVLRSTRPSATRMLISAPAADPARRVAAGAEINIRVAEGRVDLSTNAAPVADVLERLSKQTGMKVVYEGSPPRQLVSVSLAGRTPAEAVVGLLEGLGLN